MKKNPTISHAGSKTFLAKRRTQLLTMPNQPTGHKCIL